MGLRMRRLAVAAGFHLSVLFGGMGVLLIGSASGVEHVSNTGALLLTFHLLTFRRIPLDRLLQQRLVREHRCGQCGLNLDLEQSWRCSCGFTSLERHAFSPCPQCGKGFRWINCPRCGVGAVI